MVWSIMFWLLWTLGLADSRSEPARDAAEEFNFKVETDVTTTAIGGWVRWVLSPILGFAPLGEHHLTSC